MLVLPLTVGCVGGGGGGVFALFILMKNLAKAREIKLFETAYSNLFCLKIHPLKTVDRGFVFPPPGGGGGGTWF